MDLGIKGRVAIVSGGSRGIGRETARELLEAGVKVMTCSRHEDQAAATCKELAKQTGGEINYVVADMTKPQDIENLVKSTLSKYGTVDILVNNAGTMYSGRFEEMTDEGLQNQFNTKLFGWLRTHVYGLGSKVSIQELLKSATGKTLSATSFIRYVEAKYLENLESSAAA